MKKETLTKSEHEIMNLLWHVDRPLTASEIIEQSTDKTWKDSYIHLLINSLLDKGMIRAEGFAKTTKNYARIFVAAVSEEAYAVQQIAGRKPLSTLSVVSIVSALVEQAEEPSALIDAVERMLAEKRKAIK
ncbi:MAG: BlaI/MecI/CopY family transcriptional regulator [Acutalibacteraceae bacterium]